VKAGNALNYASGRDSDAALEDHMNAPNWPYWTEFSDIGLSGSIIDRRYPTQDQKPRDSVSSVLTTVAARQEEWVRRVPQLVGSWVSSYSRRARARFAESGCVPSVDWRGTFRWTGLTGLNGRHSGGGVRVGCSA
jgi:hypothetical protein